MNAVARQLAVCLVCVLAIGGGQPLESVQAGSEAPSAQAATPTTGIRLKPLCVGDRIAIRTYENDRIEWKLPKARLERFRAAGVIINEERHITSLAEVIVIAANRQHTTLRVTSHLSSFDVPRNQMIASSDVFDLTLAPDNEPSADQRLDIANAAMVGLPLTATTTGHVGQRWHTHLKVMTTLGDGDAIFEHEVVGIENGLVEITVHGSGKITGLQYHLPKLLPGIIELSGAGWYDPYSGLVSQESYWIHNRLLKPAEGEQIGFDERLSVDSVTRLTARQKPCRRLQMPQIM